jgi:AbrB family looped-hinge helix DNA binding protein
MARSSIITSKGRITFPIEIRKRLRLKPGDRVEFVVKGSRIFVRRAGNPKKSFLNYVGAFPAFSTLEETNAWVEGMRDSEPGCGKRRKK